MLRNFIFLFLAICSINLHASPLSDAAAMLDKEEYETAFKLFSQLANSGDVTAQYNLGVIYKNGLGQEKDKAKANYWFAKAAKGGLVPAYLQLQDKSIAPAVGTHVKTEYTAEEWVKVQNPANYTLQLASSTNKQLIEKYYYENSLQGKAGYYRNRRQGEYWYALVYGSYPNIEKANEAVAALPENLKKWSPWVRKVKDIHRLMNH
jgi:septal ring-binding cell division protein DamX